MFAASVDFVVVVDVVIFVVVDVNVVDGNVVADGLNFVVGVVVGVTSEILVVEEEVGEDGDLLGKNEWKMIQKK